MDHSAHESSGEKGANDNIEAVRDLLFGKRTAEISGRITEAEHSLKGALSRLENELGNKIGVVETMVEDQMESHETRISSIDNRLKSEADTRIKQGENLRKSIDETESTLTERINAIEDRLHKFETKIWSELHSRSKKHEEDISALRTELFERISDELSVVADKAPDRRELGDFLIDLGLKIQPVSDTKKRRSDEQPELAG